MYISIVRADRTNDKVIKALADIDARIFPHKADLFSKKDWQYFRKIFEFFWITANGVIVGSVHLGPNLEWEEDLPTERRGCLYFAGLGILPEFRCKKVTKEIFTFLSGWQVDYARAHGFERIVATIRKSNTNMIRICEKSGFRITHEVPDFWERPNEPAVILEFTL
jgi:RimJ/RimL family protein N-acetyltransferase